MGDPPYYTVITINKFTNNLNIYYISFIIYIILVLLYII